MVLVPFSEKISVSQKIKDPAERNRLKRLINSIRPRKRYAPWLKTSKINNLELVKEYFGYNDQKAKDALDLLTDDQLEHIQTKLNKGGNAR